MTASVQDVGRNGARGVSRGLPSRFRLGLRRRKQLRLLSAPLRMLPDFLILGTRKGGTSSLHEYLAAHPCVGPAFAKEVHFFDHRFDRGVNWYRAHFPLRVVRWWREQVTGLPFISGEASPYYLFHPLVPERARQVTPEAKLLVLLRNPVDRAYSDYQHQLRCGRDSLSFEAAVEQEEERLARQAAAVLEGRESFSHKYHSYLTRGRYAEQLEAWLQHFPREQFLIFDSGDLAREPARVVERAQAFLGLPPWRSPAYPMHNSASYPPQNAATRARLLRHFAPHNERLYALLGERFDWERE